MKIIPRKAPKLLGILLAGTLIATIAVSRQNDSSSDSSFNPQHERKKGRGAERTAALKRDADADDKAVAVKLDKLALREEITEPMKDIFASKSWYVPPPPPPKPLHPPLPPAPTAPPIPFVFMGQQLEDENNIVVYLTKGGQAYVVRQGDIIDNLYRVESATPRQLVLTYLPLSIQQTLQTGAGS